MISELDETIRKLLVRQGGLDPLDIDIRFEIPDREWSSTISKPTVNCYLYDIHENRQMREEGWLEVQERNGGDRAGRRRPYRRIALAYLITAWTKAVEDEHRLLWQVLATMIQNPVLPVEVLEGPLAELDEEIFTSVAQIEGPMRSPGEFWSALDNKLKPSLSYVVTVPVDPAALFLAPRVLDREVRMTEQPVDPPHGTAHVSGVVRGVGGRGVRAARILVVGTNQAVTADHLGRYSLRAMPIGRHSLAVAAPGQMPKERQIDVPAENYDLDLIG